MGWNRNPLALFASYLAKLTNRWFFDAYYVWGLVL